MSTLVNIQRFVINNKSYYFLALWWVIDTQPVYSMNYNLMVNSVY